MMDDSHDLYFDENGKQCPRGGHLYRVTRDGWLYQVFDPSDHPIRREWVVDSIVVLNRILSVATIWVLAKVKNRRRKAKEESHAHTPQRHVPDS